MPASRSWFAASAASMLTPMMQTPSDANDFQIEAVPADSTDATAN
jgi:hypothetical protein